MTQWPAGIRREIFAEIGSTNAEGLIRLAAGERGPLWLRADWQLAGRGRDGRAWASPAGNLYASLVLHVPCDAWTGAQVSLVAGVALIEALQAIAPGPAYRLKWPNDVLIGDAKLAGILVESVIRVDGLGAVIGFGVNLAHAPGGLGRPVTALSQHGLTVAPDAALSTLANAFVSTSAIWDAGRGFPDIRLRWQQHGPLPGAALVARGHGAAISGAYLGLDDNGALLLQDATGLVQRITFGDVEYEKAN